MTQTITRRDWFAGQALAGVLANPNMSRADPDEDKSDMQVIAEAAFGIADAMLAASATTEDRTDD